MIAGGSGSLWQSCSREKPIKNMLKKKNMNPFLPANALTFTHCQETTQQPLEAQTGRAGSNCIPS